MVKLNKIYTRTGDGGTAGLVDGSRVSKSSLRMTAIGEVDEANAAIGVVIATLTPGDLPEHLKGIQNDMFDLGADLERKLTEEQRALIARAYKAAGAEAVDGFRKVALGMINETDRSKFKSGGPR